MGFLAKDWDYLVLLVLLVLLAHQLECVGADLVLLALLALLVLQLEHLGVDLGENVGNLLLILLSELITIADLPVFFLSPLPLPLPFTCGFCTDFALGLIALEATGIHVGKCTDLDLVLGLPALDVDAMGLSAIRHSTICQNLLLTLLKIKVRSLIHICS